MVVDTLHAIGCQFARWSHFRLVSISLQLNARGTIFHNKGQFQILAAIEKGGGAVFALQIAK